MGENREPDAHCVRLSGNERNNRNCFWAKGEEGGDETLAGSLSWSIERRDQTVEERGGTGTSRCLKLLT